MTYTTCIRQEPFPAPAGTPAWIPVSIDTQEAASVENRRGVDRLPGTCQRLQHGNVQPSQAIQWSGRIVALRSTTFGPETLSMRPAYETGVAARLGPEDWYETLHCYGARASILQHSDGMTL